MFSAMAFPHGNETFEMYATDRSDQKKRFAFRHSDGSGKSGAIEVLEGESKTFGKFTVTHTGKEVSVNESGGITVQADGEIDGAMTIMLQLPEKYKGKVQGLMGNYNGDRSDDDGDFAKHIASPSLFSETMPSVPPGWSANYRPTQEDVRKAEKICAGAGLTDAHDKKFCVEDVSMTGNSDWAHILKAAETESGLSIP